MPLPLIPVAIVLAGTVGAAVKKAWNASDMMDEAKKIADDAEHKVKLLDEVINDRKAIVEQNLTSLGQLKLNILSGNIHSFVDEFSKMKNVNFNDSIGIDELRNFNPSNQEFIQLKTASLNAVEITSGLGGAFVGGGLAAVGAYGAVGYLATASTGAAISGLSGAAAYNATLAWLGGGSLASGGLGIAGGTAVLGGLVVAPAALIAAWWWECKAEEALNKAKAYKCKAEAWIANGNKINKYLKAVTARAEQIEALLADFDRMLAEQLEIMLKNLRKNQSYDWNDYSVNDQKQIAITALLTKAIKQVIDTPLLYEDGTLADESSFVEKYRTAGYKGVVDTKTKVDKLFSCFSATPKLNKELIGRTLLLKKDTVCYEKDNSGSFTIKAGEFVRVTGIVGNRYRVYYQAGHLFGYLKNINVKSKDE